MVAGRKPQPAARREQKSAVRSKREETPPLPVDPSTVATDATPTSPADAIRATAPDWLAGEGRKIWERLAPTLSAARLLTAVDSETFARYCRNFARWLKLHAELDRDGETYETETYGAGGAAPEGEEGRPAGPKAKLKRAHPAFLIADRVERQLLAAEDRFGLNPAERQRIFAARAQSGFTGDLFENPSPRRGGDDPASKPTEAAEPVESPIGILQ